MTSESAEDISRIEPHDRGYGAALDAAHALALDYLQSLAQRPVSLRPTPETMSAALDEPLSEQGCDPAEAVRQWFSKAEPGIVASPGPRFFGFVNGGSTPAALAGDWLSSAIDQNAGLWLASPAAAQTELVVLDWLKSLFGLPVAWGGALTSGATMANLTGLAAARQWAGQRLGFDAARDGLAGHPAIPVISTIEIHASARKALATLGLGRGTVNALPVADGGADPAALDAVLAGQHGPAIVIANAGEVNSGGFDPVAAIADRCAAHTGGAWLHVDGAFGLFAAASPRFAHLVAGIDRADSVAADGHKWLNVPYDSGFVFVRDLEALRAAFTVDAAYLTADAGSSWDPHTHVPEMSRRFRALAAWCALKSLGRDGYRDLVERCVANAQQFASWVEDQSDLELTAPATLNIVCFRLRPVGVVDGVLDALNREAVVRIQSDGRVFVSGTHWRGSAAIRAAFDNWSTTADDVRILEETVAEIATTIIDEAR